MALDNFDSSEDFALEHEHETWNIDPYLLLPAEMNSRKVNEKDLDEPTLVIELEPTPAALLLPDCHIAKPEWSMESGSLFSQCESEDLFEDDSVRWDDDPLDVSIALQRQKPGFARQGLIHFLVGVASIGLPLILYARVAAFHLPGRMEVLLSEVPVIGVLELVVGLWTIIGGIRFVESAQKLVLKTRGVPARVKLSKKRRTLCGVEDFVAQITYADGRSEEINVCGAGNSDFDALTHESDNTTVFGEQFNSHDAPRVLNTRFGTLLSLANEAAILRAITKRDDGVKTTSVADWCRKLTEQNVKQLFRYTALTMAISLVYAQITPWMLPFWWGLSGSGIFVFVMRLWRLCSIGRQLKEVVECSVVITQPNKLTNSLKARILAVGTAEHRVYDLCGAVPRGVQGQAMEATMAKDAGGNLMFLKGANFCVLAKSKKFAYINCIPAIVYFAMMPMLFCTDAHLSKDAPLQCKSAQEYYDKAVEFQTFGWTEKARAALNKAIDINPNGAIGKKATEYLHAKIPANVVPEVAERLNNRGDNLMNGDNPSAIKIFQECIEKYPQFEWPYSNLAQIFISEGRAPEALQLLQKALEINPRYTNGLRNMVDAELTLGNREGAKRYLDMAIASEPDAWHLRLQRFALDCSI